jgi:hypothetical protein
MIGRKGAASRLGAYLEIECLSGGGLGDQCFGVTWGSPSGSGWASSSGRADCLTVYPGSGQVRVDTAATGVSIGSYAVGDRMGLLLIDRSVWISDAGVWANSGAPVAHLPLAEGTFYPFVYSYSGDTWEFFTGSDLDYLPADLAAPMDFSALTVINDGGSAGVSGLQFSGAGTGRVTTAVPLVTAGA